MDGGLLQGEQYNPHSSLSAQQKEYLEQKKHMTGISLPPNRKRANYSENPTNQNQFQQQSTQQQFIFPQQQQQSTPFQQQASFQPASPSFAPQQQLFGQPASPKPQQQPAFQPFQQPSQQAWGTPQNQAFGSPNLFGAPQNQQFGMQKNQQFAPQQKQSADFDICDFSVVKNEQAKQTKHNSPKAAQKKDNGIPDFIDLDNLGRGKKSYGKAVSMV